MHAEGVCILNWLFWKVVVVVSVAQRTYSMCGVPCRRLNINWYLCICVHTHVCVSEYLLFTILIVRMCARTHSVSLIICSFFLVVPTCPQLLHTLTHTHSHAHAYGTRSSRRCHALRPLLALRLRYPSGCDAVFRNNVFHPGLLWNPQAWGGSADAAHLCVHVQTVQTGQAGSRHNYTVVRLNR